MKNRLRSGLSMLGVGSFMCAIGIYLLLEDSRSRGISIYGERLFPTSSNFGPMPLLFTLGSLLVLFGLSRTIVSFFNSR